MRNQPTDRLPRARDPQLRLALVRDDGRRYSLPHCKAFRIGSAPGSELRLDDRYASCKHARICHTAEGYRIEDLGSTNGTMVDGVHADSAVLEPGMVLEVGRVRLTVTRIDRPADELRPRRVRTPAQAEPARGRPAHRLVGRSKPMVRLRRQLEKLAPLELSVLITGETGTGKELAARTLHEFSPRFEEPFVALNCGAIPAGLFESELFGHRRGAFTGAHRDNEGAFIRAKQGTVFLDEIGELPLLAQAKLLRVLETRRLVPVGGSSEREIECRIVAATHRDLHAMVAKGEFREDLFHRLSVVAVELPALRRRRRDIPSLLEHFAVEIGHELDRELVIAQPAVAAALSYPWPGNVRELRNALLRAAALSEGPIGAKQLLPDIQRPRRTGDLIAVPRGNYASMQAALVQAIVAEEGSIRRAATVLEVPRSTLSAWVRRFAEQGLDPLLTRRVAS